MKIMEYFSKRFGMKKESGQLDKNFKFWDDQSVELLTKRASDLKSQIVFASSKDSYEAKVKASDKQNELMYVEKLIELKTLKAQIGEKRESGSVKGPGVPDGTGPHGGTDKCQLNNKEDDTEEKDKKDKSKEKSKKEAMSTGDYAMITLQKGDPDYAMNGEVGKIQSVRELPYGISYKVSGKWWRESDVRAHKEGTENWSKEEQYKDNLKNKKAMKKEANLNCDQAKEYVLLEIWYNRYNPFTDILSDSTEEGLKNIANKLKVYGASESKAEEFVKEQDKYFTDNFEKIKENRSLFLGNTQRC